ncbi:MAG: hypothetical protein J5527_07430 [Treponema sp.]|nr:hypothetical protein [Treponema sp.]
MSDILFIGKDLPDSIDFAEGLASINRNVFTSTKDETEAENFAAENIFSATWNKTSAISARSFLIKAETKFPDINEYLLYFDSYYYSTKFELDKTEYVTAATDSLISSYQLFINELLSRLEQKKEPSVIAFMAKTYPSKYEVLHNGTKGVNIHPASNIVSAAQEAFLSLAENTSTLVGERPYLSVLLSKCDYTNEFFSSEKQLASWLAQGIDSIKGMKNHQTAKQAGTWVKAGAKIPTGLSLFSLVR